MPRTTSDFQIGDRVVLIAPFRCRGDTPEGDKEWDAQIRDAVEDGSLPIGTVLEVHEEVIRVHWEAWADSLWANPDVLDLERPPVTDDEVAEAIQSINKALGGSHE